MGKTSSSGNSERRFGYFRRGTASIEAPVVTEARSSKLGWGFSEATRVSAVEARDVTW